MDDSFGCEAGGKTGTAGTTGTIGREVTVSVGFVCVVGGAVGFFDAAVCLGVCDGAPDDSPEAAFVSGTGPLAGNSTATEDSSKPFAFRRRRGNFGGKGALGTDSQGS